MKNVLIVSGIETEKIQTVDGSMRVVLVKAPGVNNAPLLIPEDLQVIKGDELEVDGINFVLNNEEELYAVADHVTNIGHVAATAAYWNEEFSGFLKKSPKCHSSDKYYSGGIKVPTKYTMSSRFCFVHVKAYGELKDQAFNMEKVKGLFTIKYESRSKGEAPHYSLALLKVLD